MQKMNVVHTGEKIPDRLAKSIFLAGPTPRSPDVVSWRPKALEILAAKGYDGVVFVPEPFMGDYEEQIKWEDMMLNAADCILFWIPRDMATLPGLTTNHEHGEWFKSGKIVLGAPPNAPKLRYLRHKAEKMLVSQAETLEGTIDLALKMIGKGSWREGTECQVPLYVWNTQSFQNWYQVQKYVGNRLEKAHVEWTFRVGPGLKIVFFWILKVEVYIAAEDRIKANEFVISRPDISTVMMYRPGETLMKTKIVLIREFRSPVSNEAGFVYEIPGGSSFKGGKIDKRRLALGEVKEETGLEIDDVNRVAFHGTRQLVATMSAHKAYLFSIELTEDEIKQIEEQAGVAHGVVEDTERTYTEVWTLRDILEEKLVDWSTVGMIMSVIQFPHGITWIENVNKNQ